MLSQSSGLILLLSVALLGHSSEQVACLVSDLAWGDLLHSCRLGHLLHHLIILAVSLAMSVTITVCIDHEQAADGEIHDGFLATLQIRKQCRVLVPYLLGMTAQIASLGEEEWRAGLIPIHLQWWDLIGRREGLRGDTFGLWLRSLRFRSLAAGDAWKRANTALHLEEIVAAEDQAWRSFTTCQVVLNALLYLLNAILIVAIPRDVLLNELLFDRKPRFLLTLLHIYTSIFLQF